MQVKNLDGKKISLALDGNTISMDALDEDNIYVVLLPYSQDPENSFKRSVAITRALRERGLTVFSPILHTHHYHLTVLREVGETSENYYKWDLSLYSHLRKRVFLFTLDWDMSVGCQMEMRFAKKYKIPVLFIVENEKNELKKEDV
ncbi:MAG: DUF1937 family protein [Promethearchaeota archaeon]